MKTAEAAPVIFRDRKCARTSPELQSTCRVPTIGLVTALAPYAPRKAAAAAARNWIAASGTIYSVKSADPAAAHHFFNVPSSFDMGGNPAASPVPCGYATTPVLNYASCASFASDISSGVITYPFRWVMYDPENWAGTPVAEKQDPIRYLGMFGGLAHAYGLRVILAPALDLGTVAGSVIPRRPGETLPQWYLRVNIAGNAAAAGDLVLVQNQSQTADISQYQWLYNSARRQARAANPAVIVNSEVSARNGTASQMAAAAQSVNADGYYVAAAGDIPAAVRFLGLMQAAGY